MDYAVVIEKVQKSIIQHHPSFKLPTTAVAPSVVMDTNLYAGSWVFSIKFLNDWNMSSPRVCPVIDSTVNSSSFAVISGNTIRMKIHTWAVSLASVGSSNCSEKHSQSAMSFQSCCIKSWAMASLRRATVLLDNWRALIEDNIFALFLKSWNNVSAASTNASFTISPSWKDFVLLMRRRLIRNNASVALKMTVVRTTGISVPSPFSFSAHVLVGSWCRILYEQSENAAPHVPSLMMWRDGTLTDKANTLWKCHCEKRVLLPFHMKVICFCFFLPAPPLIFTPVFKKRASFAALR